MSHSDPIADLFTRLRNAAAVGHASLSVPHSKQKEILAKTLVREDVLVEAKVEGKGVEKVLLLKLPAKGTAYLHYKRISKPGQRIYIQVDRIKRIQNGLGLALISTSKGIMTDQEARKAKMGGELLVEIW
ncbi:MAG: 30S ribosomal protein S8 [Candidatus Abawacabacteria bacterium RIFCSPHIGHO2_01_FULL_46_8]|uniref:Small ribosomal subunit protein uS8 n=1 Tax=Candidatus Abawacabacteria bacterium RIFCSPHIGHO2_01_FULL_46_8 TaxID=1817815 RepID=A0A1F4XPH3_9BACT|nr:ribosomal protein S8 [uncultured bacterium]OGC82943.1 MAG: 30S ribosomal protein S8 [Candidatus Abawacabacteria bacterium RIFCSPHIGHO2_01_FULL_46_8]